MKELIVKRIQDLLVALDKVDRSHVLRVKLMEKTLDTNYKILKNITGRTEYDNLVYLIETPRSGEMRQQ